LSVIEFENNYDGNKELMIHGTTLCRDIHRSSQLPKRMEKKYNNYDLVLGGYGGETLRAKYNYQSPFEYYGSNKAEKLFSDAKYGQKLLSKTELYPDLNTNNQMMNLIYTIDRMRIWGGSWITMSSIYGDVIHPFMDWHLINPVFSLPPKQLEKGVYQQQIIDHFAPEIGNLPINATNQFDHYYRNIKKRLSKNVKRNELATVLAKRVLSLTKARTDKKVDLMDDLDESIFIDLNINLDNIKNTTNTDIASRALTVSTFHNHVKHNSLN